MDEINWKKVGVIALVINGAYAALVTAAVASVRADERRRNAPPRWTDANRWEKP